VPRTTASQRVRQTGAAFQLALLDPAVALPPALLQVEHGALVGGVVVLGPEGVRAVLLAPGEGELELRAAQEARRPLLVLGGGRERRR